MYSRKAVKICQAKSSAQDWIVRSSCDFHISSFHICTCFKLQQLSSGRGSAATAPRPCACGSVGHITCINSLHVSIVRETCKITIAHWELFSIRNAWEKLQTQLLKTNASFTFDSFPPGNRFLFEVVWLGPVLQRCGSAPFWFWNTSAQIL